MAVTRYGNGVIKMTAASDSITGETFLVKKVRWTGGTTVNHVCLVSDGGSAVVAHLTLDVAGHDDEMDFTGFKEGGLQATGLVATTLDSGTVYIYT